MKIFGFEILPSKKINNLTQEMIELKNRLDVVQKSSYSTLWQLALEEQLTGKKVTRPYAQIPDIYKPIKAIADNAPQAEIAFYDDATNKEIWPEDLVKLFKKPNKEMSQEDFVQECVGYYALRGECMIRKITSIGQLAGTYKLPAELIPLNPKEMSEITAKNDSGKEVIKAWRYEGREVIPAEEVIHIKDFNPYSKFRGLAPTNPIKDIIDLDYDSLKYNKAFFKNYATLGLYLATDKSLTQEQRDQIIEWITKEHTGTDKPYKTTVLENGLKPNVVGSTHKDMEFIEQRKHGTENMLGIWRAPKALFNITDTLNYATFVGQMKIFILYTLMPIYRKFAGGLNRGVVTLYNPLIELRMKLDNMPAFQEDYKEKVNTALLLQQMGWPINAINDKLNLGFDPVSWGNTWWMNISQIPADEYDIYNSADNYDENEEDVTIDDDSKTISKDKKFKSLIIWKSFLKRQVPLENKLAYKVKKYFYQQRMRALASLSNNNNQVILNWNNEDDELQKVVKPIFKVAVEEGARQAESLIGDKKGIEEDRLQQLLDSYVQVKADKITRINMTIKQQIAKSLQEGISEGLSADQLADKVKSIYNMAGNRAKMISRTETTGAINGGSDIYYDEKGVMREWITAGDEHVRESHRNINGEVRRPKQAFSNGLQYPGDQSAGDPGEIINCRCTIAPVIER